MRRNTSFQVTTAGLGDNRNAHPNGKAHVNMALPTRSLPTSYSVARASVAIGDCAKDGITEREAPFKYSQALSV